MAEKVLAYDRARVTQDTGFNCGPATCQNILDMHGKRYAEADLGRRMGTHTGGTDHIGLLATVLRAELPAANWTVVQLPADPPTQAQREALWQHLTRSIDGGYAVAVNIVAPPSNYPKVVAPSTTPFRYSGGTVYHYITASGYSDTGGVRKVWIIDSGFYPYGGWISFAQLATLIPPKGYCYANVNAPAKPALPPVATTALGAYRGAPVTRSGAGSNSAPPTRQAIIVHDTEGAFDGAISWMISQQNGSYHILRALDGRGVRLVPDARQAWAAMGTGNRIGLHISIEGYAKWTRAEWLAKGRDGLEGLAHDIAAWSKTYGVPLARITAADLRAGKRGIATHADVSAAWRETDHTDPGAGFPLDLVIARAKDILNPTQNGGLTMAQIDDIYKALGRIEDQLGPKRDNWGPGSSFGKDEQGRERTARDGLIAKLDRLQADIDAIRKAVTK
ncbi:MAG: N-acetylmuramoyl-L-alanine amidase [Anaerolineae bacterium]